MTELQEDAPLSDEEREFQKVITLIGGKERIYLVCDTRQTKDADGENVGILDEFMRELFHDGTCAKTNAQPRTASTNNIDCSETQCLKKSPKIEDVDLKDAPVGKDTEKGKGNEKARITVTRRFNIYSLKRAIDSPVIVFMFRQTFVSKESNNVCIKEILKDVKARTKHATIARPALIGLIHSRQESAETRCCVQNLDRLIRSVFCRHSPETIWTECFIPKAEAKVLSIKMNACKVISSSQTTGVMAHIGHRGGSVVKYSSNR